MRPLLAIIAVVILVLIVGVATGFINLSGTAGELPKVAVQGGELPKVDADVGSVQVGTKPTQVDVPTVGTKKETIDVPVVGVTKPN